MVTVTPTYPDGFTEEDFIEKIKEDEGFAKKHGELGPVYGRQWVNWGGYELISGREIEGINKGVNQIQNVIDLLRTNPDSRRIMVNAWNVAEIDKAVLPSCHFGFQLYTEELTLNERKILAGNEISTFISPITVDYWDSISIPKRKISLKFNMRSVDLGLGLSFNIASYAFLLEMIAQQVNMIPDKLVGDLTNVHIYRNHIEPLKMQLKRDVDKYSAPKLILNKAKDIFSYKLEDFNIEVYESYPIIKMILSN